MAKHWGRVICCHIYCIKITSAATGIQSLILIRGNLFKIIFLQSIVIFSTLSDGLSKNPSVCHNKSQ